MNHTHLSIEERCCLRKYYNEGNSLRKIAKLFGRNVSTISREIMRNKTYMNCKPAYYPHTAQKKSNLRKSYWRIILSSAALYKEKSSYKNCRIMQLALTKKQKSKYEPYTSWSGAKRQKQTRFLLAAADRSAYKGAAFRKSKPDRRVFRGGQVGEYNYGNKYESALPTRRQGDGRRFCKKEK